MAERCLLHFNKLDLFKEFLTTKGYEIQDTKGIYEVLRAKKNKNTIIVFKKDEAKEHFSTQSKDYYLVKDFIKNYKRGEYNG